MPVCQSAVGQARVGSVFSVVSKAAVIWQVESFLQKADCQISSKQNSLPSIVLERYREILYGHLRGFESRVLVVVLLYATVSSTFIGLTGLFSSLYKDLSIYALPLAFCLLGLYLVLRFHKRAQRHTTRFAFLAVILCLFYLAFLWPVSQGSYGNTPFFFLILVFYQLLLFQGRFLLLNILMSLLVIFGLIFYESQNPDWLQPQPNSIPSTQHAIETALSLAIAVVLTYVIGSSYKRGWNRLVNQRERHKKEFEEDLILSRNLQKQIYKYPKELVRDFDFHAHILPSSEIGGDLFELSNPQEGCLRVFLADAQGHGINAALSSVLIKGEWARLKDRKMNPATLLNKLNARIIDSYGDNIIFTALVADIFQDKIVFSSAGHPEQYIVTCRSEASAEKDVCMEKKIVPLENSGPPAGMFEFNRYTQREYDFPKNARVLFFTDALIEEGQEQFEDSEDHLGWLHRLLERKAQNSKDFSSELLRSFAARIGQDANSLHLKDDLLLLIVSHQK